MQKQLLYLSCAALLSLMACEDNSGINPKSNTAELKTNPLAEPKTNPPAEPKSGPITRLIGITDPGFRKYLQDRIPEAFDGIWLNVDHEKVKGLQLIALTEEESKQIRNLTGIEYFTSLRYLVCNNSQLERLDVSRNKDLQYLFCSKNKKLTSLDVSQNTALEKLRCGNCQLKSLNVRGAKALKELDCLSNLLEKLDVSQNEALTHLDCTNNRIKTLILKGAKALTDLSCHINKLEKLDVSGNVNLRLVGACSNPELKMENITLGKLDPSIVKLCK